MLSGAVIAHSQGGAERTLLGTASTVEDEGKRDGSGEQPATGRRQQRSDEPTDEPGVAPVSGLRGSTLSRRGSGVSASRCWVQQLSPCLLSRRRLAHSEGTTSSEDSRCSPAHGGSTRHVTALHRMQMPHIQAASQLMRIGICSGSGGPRRAPNTAVDSLTAARIVCAAAGS